MTVRQARYDPELLEAKKIRPTAKNLLDTDFSRGDDSDDQEFEIVVRPKPHIKIGETSKAPTTTEEVTGVSVDDDISLAEILAILKKIKKTTPLTIPESPDQEMLNEFAINHLGKSRSSSSKCNSSSESEGYTGEKDVVEEESSNEIFTGDAQDVVLDIANMEENIDSEECDFGKFFSTKFYSEDVLVLWPLFITHGLIEERIIDMEAYARQNLIQFLKDRKLLPTVTIFSRTVALLCLSSIAILCRVLEMCDRLSMGRYFFETIYTSSLPLLLINSLGQVRYMRIIMIQISI